METKNKGQAGQGIVSAMILLVVVGFLGIVMVTVYSSIESSLSGTLSSSTSDAAATVGNFTENFYDGADVTSNLPILMGAGVLLSAVIGFALYVKG